MKRLVYIVLSMLLSVSLLPACSDLLDIDPTDRFSSSTVWENEEALRQYVIGFYSILKESSELMGPSNNKCWNFSDAYSDIMKSSSWNQYNHPFNVALLQETTFTGDDAGPHSCWNDCYTRIRRYNEFLRDAPSYVEKYGQEFIDKLSGEVRFMRAYAYFKLIRVYGGVVVRETLDGPDMNDKPRSSVADSWDFVIKDLGFAGEKLPVTWDATDNGRVTKAAAYGLLSRVALYAERWDVVVDAAAKCKEFGGTLSTNPENYAYKGKYDPEEGYAKVFANASNPENLLVVNFKSGVITNESECVFRPSGDKAFHNNAPVYSAIAPTSELVDSYEMADGTPFDKALFTNGGNPYEGRDPRFYASILYNGAEWENRKIETCEGGRDGIQVFKNQGTATSTVTGYYLRKWITEGATAWEKNGGSHFAIVIRYAEVLLNKAEALARADWSANKTDALGALNEVRSRVGLKAVDASSEEEFMEALRHERMVELAGEGFRYWDIRRWKLGEELIHGCTAHGMWITGTKTEIPGTDPVEYEYTAPWTYKEVEVDAGMNRIFYDRYYAFSLPLSEISNNKAIGFANNNPGW